MSLENWLNSHLIEKYKSSSEEIRELLAVADTEIKDFQVSVLSKSTRYMLAFHVVLRLSMIALYGLGYRITDRNKHHYLAIASLEFTTGSDKKEIRYFDKARQKRHGSVYDTGDEITETELEELMEKVIKLREKTGIWLNEAHLFF